MFNKYPSLTNHYQEKDISRFISATPANTSYVVFEKVDGANISFYVSPINIIRVYSRNQDITGSDFYGAGDVIEEMMNILGRKNFGIPITVFGELYGPGIQKRVDYGPGKKIILYDMMVNNKLIPQKSLWLWAKMNYMDHLFAEPVGLYQSFETAMEFNTKFNTNYGPKKDPINLTEGVVIKPWNNVIFTPQGSVFYIKKKNPEFGDKKKREPKPKTIYSDEVENMAAEFMSYINENTIQSVFSKEGEIAGHKEIGKYIPLVIKDAMNTFSREVEYDEEQFTKEERKYIFNCAGEVVGLLKKYL